MKTIILRCLMVATLILSLAGMSSCCNEYKDMLPGEVRLVENDFRNDEAIRGIEYTEDEAPKAMSALEVRTIWHAVIANAENNLENNPEGRRLYGSAEEAKAEFHVMLQNSMKKMAEEYPAANQAIVQELQRAEVKVYVKYKWCVQTEQYSDLEIEVTPNTASPEGI